MGFGSYAEDDHEQPDIETSEVDVQQDARTNFEGEMAFDAGATTADLLTTLGDIKADTEQQE